MSTASPPETSQSKTAQRSVRSRTGNSFRALLVIVALAVCGMLGFGIGRLSAFATSATPVEEPPPIMTWRYDLPKLSEKLNDSYRSIMEETAGNVDAVMKAYPNSLNAISALGIFHYLAHDGVGEEKVWRHCLAIDPKNDLAYSRLVALAQQNANYSRIVELMQHALRHDPENSVRRGMLASALMYLNRFDEAREQLETISRAGDATMDTYMLLGEVSNQQNRLEKAKRYLELAIEMAPNRLDALYSLFKVCTKLGLQQEANQHLARFQELKAQQQANETKRIELEDELYIPPRVAEIETFIGKAYLENREFEQAEKYFRQAAKRSEKDLESRKMLIEMMSGMQKWGEAIRLTKELRALEPENGLHYWHLGLLYGRARMYDEAEKIFRNICRLQPDRDVGFASLAELYLQTNQKMDEARGYAERAVELDPTARNYWILGGIAQKQRDLVTARAALERALKLDPNNAAMKKMYDSLSQ